MLFRPPSVGGANDVTENGNSGLSCQGSRNSAFDSGLTNAFKISFLFNAGRKSYCYFLRLESGADGPMGLDSSFAEASPWKKFEGEGNDATFDDATVVTLPGFFDYFPILIPFLSSPRPVEERVVLSGLDDLHNEQSLRNDHLLCEAEPSSSNGSNCQSRRRKSDEPSSFLSSFVSPNIYGVSNFTSARLARVSLLSVKQFANSVFSARLY